MASCPIALGLTLCDYVIVEERTKKVSLIGTFTGIGVDRFPVIAQPFCAFAVLTDGLGDVTRDLIGSHLDTGEEAFAHRSQVRFPDKLTEVRFLARLRQCSFPAAGLYQFTLLANGEWVAQRRLRVYQREAES